MKKIYFIILILCFVLGGIFGQQNLSVPLNDPVYDVLEYIQIRDYVKDLHNARPYTLNLIINTLYEALDHPKISSSEKELIIDTIERLSPPEPTEIVENASFMDTVYVLGKTGTYRYENTDMSIPANVEIGADFTASVASNFNEPNISTENWLNVYLKGDLSDHFSYNINADLGIMKLDFNAYQPYSFDQKWGGYQYVMSDLSSFAGKSEELAAGINLQPELGVSFFNNKMGFSFSRVRRDWGIANGSLVLSETAQPFVGFEMYLHPVDFISLSTITGILEYYRETGIKGDAMVFQNAYSAFMGEMFIGDYIYANINSTVVWPKRFELGYMFPLMIPFFYQNMIGDFDNMLMGASLGISIPQSGLLYFNLFMDELNLSSDDFFHKDRNMYSYQVGMKIAVPNTSFTTFNIQYTKLEPYMYSHPGSENPWYENKDIDEDGKVDYMRLDYVNHGENLGYYLPPNSDELKISANAMPYWFLKTNLTYSLIRHGATYGEGKVDGSDLSDKNYYYGSINGDSSDEANYTKYFLRDGVYEWIHSLGIDAQLNLGFINDIPLTLNMAYTISYKHHTKGVDNDYFKPYKDDEYKNTWANYFTLSVKVW